MTTKQKMLFFTIWKFATKEKKEYWVERFYIYVQVKKGGCNMENYRKIAERLKCTTKKVQKIVFQMRDNELM